MRRNKLACIVCVIAATALIVPASVMGASPKASSSEKQWTVMIYYDADNSLNFTTEFEMSVWERALTSNADVNVVALIDLKSPDGTWIYDFEGGARNLVATWPEMNTSDPLVLEQFVQFCMDNFPAEKTMLDLSDHGYAWRGLCEDETNGDTLMSVHSVAKALTDIKDANNGNGIDIVACDACNMASVEMAYELSGTASIFLASETTVPYDGLPYKMFISQMMADPAVTPVNLATLIVHDYVTYYGSKWDYEHIYRYQQDFATISAWDLSKTAAMGPTFDTMTALLEPLIPKHMKQVERARGYALIGTWTNQAGYEWTPDAYAFFDGLRGMDARLDAAISDWETSFEAAKIAEDHSKKYGDSVHGLNINFPPSLSQYNCVSIPWESQFVYTGVGLELISQSSWNDCLMTYYSCSK